MSLETNTGMDLHKRSYPTIREYYIASSRQGDRPITYQRGLSNYSNLALGDERINFPKSLSRGTFTPQVNADKLNVIKDAHIRNKSKSRRTRRNDYNEAWEIVGFERLAFLEDKIKERIVECTGDSEAELKKVFNYLDRNHSRIIDLYEFARALNMLGLHFKEIEVFAIFGLSDPDLIGGITYSVFAEKFSNLGKHHDDSSTADCNGFTNHFNEYNLDDNSDEELDQFELGEIHRSKMHAYFNAVDVNKEGVLDKRGVDALLDKLQSVMQPETRNNLQRALRPLATVDFKTFFEAWCRS